VTHESTVCTTTSTRSGRVTQAPHSPVVPAASQGPIRSDCEADPSMPVRTHRILIVIAAGQAGTRLDLIRLRPCACIPPLPCVLAVPLAHQMGMDPGGQIWRVMTETLPDVEDRESSVEHQGRSRVPQRQQGDPKITEGGRRRAGRDTSRPRFRRSECVMLRVRNRNRSRSSPGQ
jgi:hypothetical protein